MILQPMLNGNIQAALIGLLAALFVIFVPLTLHEWAHAWSAYKLGDPTAKNMGRKTLNPMAHIDYLGALMIIFVGFGWAKPVPVNQRNFANPKKDMALSAAAGPLSNLVFAYILMLTANLLLFGGILQQIPLLQQFFVIAIHINILLMAFNLLPVPPLDGSRILFAFLPDRLYYKMQQYERYTMLIVFALMIFGVTRAILNPMIAFVWRILNFLAFGPLLGITA